jgi:hypothetical protein
MRNTVQDYDRQGQVYSIIRRPDPIIQQRIEQELGTAHRVLNVGAGAGSHEPEGRAVVAGEPSLAMRLQRRLSKDHVTRRRALSEGLAGKSRIVRLAVSLNCPGRFQVALYGRPEEFLREEVRRSQSAWNFLPAGIEARFVRRLSGDLASGAWEQSMGTYARSRRSLASSDW